jgi:hypothetical protein
MKLPLLVAAAFAAIPLGHVHAIDSVVPVEPPSDPEPWIADYEGEVVDLRFGWDGAGACQTDGIETTCYDTEEEMLASIPSSDLTPSSTPGISGFARISCSSYLRLYSGPYYTGSVLALTTRYTVLNLSNYGFNNVTSSYRVGGCDSYFYDYSSGGGLQYSGPTWAWSLSTLMNSGWDNRVSSVYIG